jgi:hypothetical protein
VHDELTSISSLTTSIASKVFPSSRFGVDDRSRNMSIPNVVFEPLEHLSVKPRPLDKSSISNMVQKVESCLKDSPRTAQLKTIRNRRDGIPLSANVYMGY